MPKHSLLTEFNIRRIKFQEETKHAKMEITKLESKISFYIKKINSEDFQRIITESIIKDYCFRNLELIDSLTRISKSDENFFIDKNTEKYLCIIAESMKNLSAFKGYQNPIFIYEMKVKKFIKPLNKIIEKHIKNILNYKFDILMADNSLQQLKEFSQYYSSPKISTFDKSSISGSSFEKFFNPSQDLTNAIDCIHAITSSQQSRNSAIDALNDIFSLQKESHNSFLK